MGFEDLTPAQQAMYLMGGGDDLDQARATATARRQKASPRAERMQESLDSLTEAMERMREDKDVEETEPSPSMENLSLFEQETTTK